MKEWCFLERVGQTALSVSKTNTCQVQLDGFEVDLVGVVGCEETQCCLCGWEALPTLGGSEVGVSTDACQV